jgi:hypothetical protein
MAATCLTSSNTATAQSSLTSKCVQATGITVGAVGALIAIQYLIGIATKKNNGPAKKLFFILHTKQAWLVECLLLLLEQRYLALEIYLASFS